MQKEGLLRNLSILSGNTFIYPPRTALKTKIEFLKVLVVKSFVNFFFYHNHLYSINSNFFSCLITIKGLFNFSFNSLSWVAMTLSFDKVISALSTLLSSAFIESKFFI